MDYELKWALAICLIAKIAALSPEFSIGEETERLEQSRGREEALRLPSLAGGEEPPATPTGEDIQGMHFNRGLGDEKLGDANSGGNQDGTDSKRVNESLGVGSCGLLESSAKWRDIRKTLHWLEKIVASNKSIPRLCPVKNPPRRKGNSFERSDPHTPKRTRGEARRMLESFPKEKKKPNNLTVNWRRFAINSRKPNIYSGRGKKWERQRKHKSRRNRSKKGGKARNKGKNFRYSGAGGPGRGAEGSRDKPPESEAAILKPNSVLSDGRGPVLGEREYFHGRRCRVVEEEARRPRVDCLEDAAAAAAAVKPGKKPEEAAKPKGKPWPHFVYHRVSSSFLHPESTGQNHRQSAYVAISVATSAKPEAADNKAN